VTNKGDFMYMLVVVNAFFNIFAIKTLLFLQKMRRSCRCEPTGSAFKMQTGLSRQFV